MNRCHPTALTRRDSLVSLSTLLVTALLPAGAAQAQAVQRNFPPKALRGLMVVAQPPLVAMDDHPTRLSPGARILDPDNRLVRPATLVSQALVVNYTLDQRGQVHQVWILSEAEAKEKRPGMGVQRNFVFESQQTAPAGTPARNSN
ncbi:hypothetical protein [Hydrogenophaga palleronii]|uniref:hypothetical protein n=1 Tax=Hydrogenophaga palleronii TaxID=65655 RepID=UPI000A019796|nr:hypothetical protein [Hydrogenophaga palleronii]